MSGRGGPVRIQCGLNVGRQVFVLCSLCHRAAKKANPAITPQGNRVNGRPSFEGRNVGQESRTTKPTKPTKTMNTAARKARHPSQPGPLGVLGVLGGESDFTRLPWITRKLRAPRRLPPAEAKQTISSAGGPLSGRTPHSLMSRQVHARVAALRRVADLGEFHA